MNAEKSFQHLKPSLWLLLLFVRDVVLFIIKFYIVVWLVMLPLTILAYLLKAFSPSLFKGQHEVPFPQALFFIVPLVVYGLWAISFLIAEMGGWRKLAKRFRAPKGFSEGQLFKRQGGGVGVMGYNGVWNIRLASAGLYISCILPFRAHHPALLIPWSEIKGVRYKRFLWHRSVQFTVGSPKLVTIVLTGRKIVEAVTSWLPQS